MVFHELYLEELETEENTISVASAGKSTRSLAKDMVLEKFCGENLNANTWLNHP